MSEPKRYGIETNDWTGDSIQEMPNGDYVLHADYAKLRAMDSLKTVSLTDSTNWRAIGAYSELKDKNARLKAEVESRTAQYNGIIDTQLKVIYELKAENERLRSL